MDLTEWAKLQEELLRAQLSVVRGYLRSEDGETRRKGAQKQSTSQISIITDILSAAGEPLGFVTGTGSIIPGLENALTGRSAGESFKVTVEPEAELIGPDPARLNLVARLPGRGDPVLRRIPLTSGR